MTLAASGGCSKNDDRRNTAEILLEQKYGEKFSVLSYDGQGMIDDYYKVTAYNNDEPDIIFEAEVNHDAQAVTDNYWAKHFCAEISARIYETIDAGDHYYVQSQLLIDDMYQTDLSMSVAEAASKNILTDLTVYVFTNEVEDLSGFYSSFNSAMSSMRELYGTLKVYYVSDKQLKSIQEYLTSNARMDDGFNQLAADSLRGSFSYSNGQLGTSLSDFENTLR